MSSPLYLRIAYLPATAGWVLPLISRLRAARSPSLRKSAETWGSSPVSELGLAVTTKLAILPNVIASVEQVLRQLGEEVEGLEDLDEYIERQLAFLPKSRELPYQVLAAIDAFVYEFRSTYEIVGKFLRCFSGEILNAPLTEEQMRRTLQSFGIEDAWIEDLADQRKLFFHETAPWLALKISSREPLKAELLVLKRNITDLENSKDVIAFTQLKAIHEGLMLAMKHLQDWLLERLDERDHQALA